ncbi:hypothetical protein D9M71_721330 [compost metagenome]
MFLGLSFIVFLLFGSKPMAIAGRLSVNKLMNRRWTGAKGTGKPRTVAYNTTKIAPAFPDNKNRMAFLIFV